MSDRCFPDQNERVVELLRIARQWHGHNVPVTSDPMAALRPTK